MCGPSNHTAFDSSQKHLRIATRDLVGEVAPWSSEWRVDRALPLGLGAAGEVFKYASFTCVIWPVLAKAVVYWPKVECL